MKKQFKELLNKTVQELRKDIDSLKMEITKGILESVSNPQKDTNLVAKKRAKLASLYTAANQKKEVEVFKSIK